MVEQLHFVTSARAKTIIANNNNNNNNNNSNNNNKLTVMIIGFLVKTILHP